jgi:transcriptional regulator NrdR family protein
MADVILPGWSPCPYCEHRGSTVRSIRYSLGRKIESRECDECSFRFDADANFAISETEARGLSGDRTGS